MIIYHNTRFTKTTQAESVPGAPIDEEGFALVYRSVNGKNQVDLSQGAADEVFAGFSLSRAVPPGRLPRVEEAVVDDGVVQLARAPLSDSVFVTIDGTPAGTIGVSGSAPAAAGDVNVDGDQLLFNAGDDGKSVYVQYHFEPSYQEAKDMTGDAPIGGDPAPEYGVVGLLLEANPITLTNFDSSVDWSGVMHPTLGANGLLTVGGAGVELTQYVVVGTPSAGNPYLTLQSRG